MKGLFVESPVFTKYLGDYLSDDMYQTLQEQLLNNPRAGQVIKGTGGLRKLRFSQPGRGKGKRGGVRIIYYWLDERSRFYMATIYNKDEMSDLSKDDKKVLKTMIEDWKNGQKT